KAAPKLSIEYLTLDEWVEAFHAAIAAGQGDAFRRRFQNVDVLLVDDVQFLTNRKEMQSELLRLTEALQTAGRQIVLTSDRPPPQIADLRSEEHTSELQSRFDLVCRLLLEKKNTASNQR